jgi:hypothetical protein
VKTKKNQRNVRKKSTIPKKFTELPGMRRTEKGTMEIRDNPNKR